MNTDHTNSPTNPGDPGNPGDQRETAETSGAHDTEHTRPLPLDEPADPTPTRSAYDVEEQPRGGRHPLSISYLVAGLVFLGIAASWALRETGVVEAGGEPCRCSR